MNSSLTPSSGSTATTRVTLSAEEIRRTANARRLASISSNKSNASQFTLIPVNTNYQPSRKKEEACTLQNIRRRLQAVRLLQINRPEPVECSSNTVLSPTDLQLRPKLLQKILKKTPVKVILEVTDSRVAWRDSEFLTECLCWHNVYRQRHGVPPLLMSSELCHLAQTWANHLAHTNKFYYRPERTIGQNLFCRPSSGHICDVTGQEVAAYWYCTIRRYSFQKKSNVLHTNANAGSFTQLVWKASKYFGIGKAHTRAGKVIVVAHYLPAGNTNGAYMQNVRPLISNNFDAETLDSWGCTSSTTVTLAI